MNRARHLVPWVAGGVLVALLAACSSVAPIDSKDTTRRQHMTPEEARTDLWSRLDAIQEVLGGTWRRVDDPVATGCRMEPDSGFYYSAGRFRDEPNDDAGAAAEDALAFWRQQGYTLGTAEFQPGDHLIAATAPNGTEIYLTINESETRIQAEGPCNEGNWVTVSDEDARRVQQMRRDSATPGPTP